MAQIGLMIEGQDGLTWPRWQRLLQAAEDLGFQCVFRSDHYTNARPPEKESLELWVSLTYAASHTKRIEFGPLVTPITFRQPALTARMAAAVDDLSGGRLILGMGAGWQEREHTLFGIPFYDVPTRFEMFTEGLEVVSQLLHTDGPVTYSGKHFHLDDAPLLPRPQRPNGPPILIGGNGPRLTLPLVARYADEWNAVYLPVGTWRERNTQLNAMLKAEGRLPGAVKRSLMCGTLFAANDADLRTKLAERAAQSGTEVTVDGLIDRGMIVGTPSMFVDQLGAFAEAGMERFMLQWLEQDNLDDLEIIARDVLPHFHTA